MHAEVISIRSLTNYEEKLYMVWKSRLLDWRLADIKRKGVYLRGSPSNLRPHRHPRMIRHRVPAKKRFDILSAPNENKRNEHIEKAARFAFLIAEQEAQRNNGYFPN